MSLPRTKQESVWSLLKKITFRLLKDNIIVPTSENHKASIERFKISK